MLKLLRLFSLHDFHRIPATLARSIVSKEKTQIERSLCTVKSHFKCCSLLSFSAAYSTKAFVFSGKKKPDSKQATNKEPDYIILRATKDDFDSILDLMHHSYYPNEPTSSSLNFKPTRVFDEETVKSMCEGISLVAKCKYTGDLLAAAINETTNPWDPDMKEKLACNIACEKSRHLLRFYAYMQRVPDLWRKYGVQKIFEIAYVVVRSDQRGKHLALNIMEDSRTLAADCGYTLVRVDCTSLFSAKVCEKMGMKLVQEIPYNTYLGQDKKPIFNPPAPHTALKTYVDDNPQGNYKKQPLPPMIIPTKTASEKTKKKS